MDRRNDAAHATTSSFGRNGLRILMYGSPTSEPLLELMQRCSDGTVLFTEDPRVFETLARFAPHLVVCDVRTFMDLRAPETATPANTTPGVDSGRTDRDHRRPHLTEREMRIVDLVGKGFHNDEIGRLLDLHPRTVKNVLSQLYLKFDVTNRTELVGSLVQHGDSETG